MLWFNGMRVRHDNFQPVPTRDGGMQCDLIVLLLLLWLLLLLLLGRRHGSYGSCDNGGSVRAHVEPGVMRSIILWVCRVGRPMTLVTRDDQGPVLIHNNSQRWLLLLLLWLLWLLDGEVTRQRRGRSGPSRVAGKVGYGEGVLRSVVAGAVVAGVAGVGSVVAGVGVVAFNES